MDDSQRCTATAKTTGERCKRGAIPGGNVCHMHGGGKEDVQKKAQERLDEMADSVTKELQDRLGEIFERMDDPDLTDEELVKLMREGRQLATAIWDRTGNGPTSKQEIDGELDLSDVVVDFEDTDT